MCEYTMERIDPYLVLKEGELLTVNALTDSGERTIATYRMPYKGRFTHISFSPEKLP